MTKAKSVHSTPRTNTSPAPAEPVIEMAKELRLWDADEGSQSEIPQAYADTCRNRAFKLGDWREAIEKMISFTQADGLDAALRPVRSRERHVR